MGCGGSKGSSADAAPEAPPKDAFGKYCTGPPRTPFLDQLVEAVDMKVLKGAKKRKALDGIMLAVENGWTEEEIKSIQSTPAAERTREKLLPILFGDEVKKRAAAQAKAQINVPMIGDDKKEKIAFGAIEQIEKVMNEDEDLFNKMIVAINDTTERPQGAAKAIYFTGEARAALLLLLGEKVQVDKLPDDKKAEILGKALLQQEKLVDETEGKAFQEKAEAEQTKEKAEEVFFSEAMKENMKKSLKEEIPGPIPGGVKEKIADTVFAKMKETMIDDDTGFAAFKKAVNDKSPIEFDYVP